MFPAEPLERLPVITGDGDPYWRLVTAFLVAYPPHSSRAYFSDLNAWYAWCGHMGVHPLAARRHHVDVWVRHLSETPQPRTGRPASPASIARRLSCLSKFYDYGIKDAELLEHSPVANVRRPKVSDDSATVGLTADELDRLLSAAEQHGPRSAALVSLLVYNGLRIAEVVACDVEHFTHQRGHRVLRIVRKGGKASTEPLAPIVLRTLETYVGERTTGPIFLNATGKQRLSYSIAYKLIRRLAKRAGIASASKISPHSLRHSFATELLAAGVPLQDVQDAMGHADPRTTRAYDRNRHSLDRHPTYTMAAQLHRTPDNPPEEAR
ncbi:MAG: tyrosine-type recombinase/integrase [Chloroflexota bacterium]|nr:tyrosine-type recombinase/integrase [Chloroflexota bacterium]